MKSKAKYRYMHNEVTVQNGVKNILNPNYYINKVVYVGLWFNNAKTTEPISREFYKIITYTSGSNIGLFLFRYIFSFKDSSPLSDDTKCQTDTFYC